jgi:PII-like signaling protein
LIQRVPVVVEIVEQAARIVAFLQETLAPLAPSALATLERAHVMMYRHRAATGSEPLTLAKPLPSPLCTLPQFQPSTTMTIHPTGVLLRVFIGESDTTQGKPLYEVILEQARQQGLAGATVLRGTEGFGANTVLRKAGLLDLSTDLPVVIEMVDVQEKIEPFLPWLEQVVREGMITMEHVSILLYRGATA